MALVNWNPVAAANFSESNALRLAAQQQLAGGIKGIGDTAVAFNDATGKANTDILLNSLVGQRTPEAAAAAIQAAKAQAGGMYNNYDQAAFRSAAEALPKSAADAQELDLQIADKPYLQAAALAYSRGDREAVGNFAKEVRSNAGRAELSKLIGDSHTMAVQDATVANAEKTLTAKIQDDQAKNDIAWYNAKTQRYEADKKSGTGSETAKNTFLNMVASVRQKFKTAADKAGTEALIGSQDTIEDKAALQNTINGKDGKGLDSWGNATGKNIHDVLLATVPGYAGTGAKNQKAVIDYLLAKNTTQTGGGWWDSMVNRDLTDEQITTLGATALGEVTANASTNLARTQELGIQDGVAQLRLEAEKLGIQATDAELREMLFPSAIPQPTAGTSKPSGGTTEAERLLRDRAESKRLGEERAAKAKSAKEAEAALKAQAAVEEVKNSGGVTKVSGLKTVNRGRGVVKQPYTYDQIVVPLQFKQGSNGQTNVIVPDGLKEPPKGFKRLGNNPTSAKSYYTYVSNNYEG